MTSYPYLTMKIANISFNNIPTLYESLKCLTVECAIKGQYWQHDHHSIRPHYKDSSLFGSEVESWSVVPYQHILILLGLS